MKLKLREARRLERRLETELNKGVKYTNTRSIYIPNSLTNIKKWVTESFEQTEKSHWSHLSLASVRNAIRREIQIMNEVSGINQIISERCLAQFQLDRWTGVVNAFQNEQDHIEDADTVQFKIDMLRKSDSTYSKDSITISTISQTLFIEAKEQVQHYQNLIDTLDDKLLSLNVGTKINLSEEHEQILREHNFIN